MQLWKAIFNFSHSSLPQAAALAVCIDPCNVDSQDRNVQRSICPNTSCYGYQFSFHSASLPFFFFFLFSCWFWNGIFSPFFNFLSLSGKLSPYLMLLSCSVVWTIQLHNWMFVFSKKCTSTLLMLLCKFNFANTICKMHFFLFYYMSRDKTGCSKMLARQCVVLATVTVEMFFLTSRLELIWSFYDDQHNAKLNANYLFFCRAYRVH